MGRWKLAGELRKLRGERTATEVAKALRMTSPTVHRWEMPGVEGMIPSPGTLARLLEFYGLTRPETERIMEIRDQAKAKGWWQEPEYDLNPSYSMLIGLETDATSLFSHESILIPGLLQEEDYVQAAVKGTGTNISNSTVDAQVKVRRQRQDSWLREGGPSLWAIVGEAALRQLVGGSSCMRVQLKHLLDISEHPRLRLQVLPFSAGSHAGMTAGAFEILELAEVGLKAVYVESRSSRLYLDNDEGVTGYLDTFDQLKMSALDIEKTRDLITEIRSGL